MHRISGASLMQSKKDTGNFLKVVLKYTVVKKFLTLVNLKLKFTMKRKLNSERGGCIIVKQAYSNLGLEMWPPKYRYM
jgi:hypothetical protein